jgi:hypothetical protein
MQALQADNTLGAVTSAASMINSFAKAGGHAAPINVGVVAALGMVGSYRGFKQAKEEGDTYGQVVQGAQFIYQGVQLYNAVAAGTMHTSVNDAYFADDVRQLAEETMQRTVLKHAA